MKEPIDWRIPLEADDWQCGWESSRRFQVRYWASLPLRDKLEGLEEMDNLARHFQERCRLRGAAYIDMDTGERVPGRAVASDSAAT